MKNALVLNAILTFVEYADDRDFDFIVFHDEYGKKYNFENNICARLNSGKKYDVTIEFNKNDISEVQTSYFGTVVLAKLI